MPGYISSARALLHNSALSVPRSSNRCSSISSQASAMCASRRGGSVRRGRITMEVECVVRVKFESAFAPCGLFEQRGDGGGKFIAALAGYCAEAHKLVCVQFQVAGYAFQLGVHS